MSTLQNNDIQCFLWLNDSVHQRLLHVLSQLHIPACFVGGCVRDSLCGHVPVDFDVATPYVPMEAVQRLENKGFKTHILSLQHGTIIARFGEYSYEVTTLRRDVHTNGRHAFVHFIDNLQEDAARRDFTINALYLTADGRVIDFFNGRQDLLQKRVRFIGNALARIDEDYLRILRYFRFMTRYGTCKPNDEALNACIMRKHYLRHLSAERITHEMLRILQAENPSYAIDIMARHHFFNVICASPCSVERFQRFNELSAHQDMSSSLRARMRLWSLLPHPELCAKICLSRVHIKQMVHWQTAYHQSNQFIPYIKTLASSELDGIKLDVFTQCLAAGLGCYQQTECLDDALKWLRHQINHIREERYIIPINGHDMRKLGAEKCDIQNTLRAVQKWAWNFSHKPTAEECLNQAQHILNKKTFNR